MLSGDLLGSLALLSNRRKKILILSCDSLTMDIMKLFGIQNLTIFNIFSSINSGNNRKIQ